MRRIIIILLFLLIVFFISACGGIEDAVERGDLKAVRVWLEKDPEAIHTINKQGYTLLHRAAREGREKIAELLLQKGLFANTRMRYGNALTPLHLAAEKGHLEMVKLLINNGADVNAGARRGYPAWTPLCFAAYKGREEVVKLLISRGAEVNAAGKEEFHISPLHLAIFSKKEGLIRLLIEKGANVNAPDYRGYTPIYVAIDLGFPEVARRLIANGADVNWNDSYGPTPLHYTVYYRKRSRKKIARLLLENGADVNAVTRYGLNVLHFAAYGGFKECAAMFLEKGVSVNNTDVLKDTPLKKAIWKGHKGMVRFLLSLHTAAREGHMDEVASLVEKYPQLLNSRDEEGKTPLHHAVENNEIEIAKLLIGRGADVNMVTERKRISLLHGVIAKLLVPRMGRIKWIKDEKTPLHIAVQKGYTRMAQLLRENNGAE
jgi:ankyrin repeat protein